MHCESSVYNAKNHFRKSDLPVCIFKSDLDNPEEIKNREPHSHDFIEIAYVSSGKGYHELNSKKRDTSRGDIHFINFDSVHMFTPIDNVNSGNLEIINCIFLPEFIDGINIEPELMKEITRIFLYSTVYEDETREDEVPALTLSGEILGNVEGIYYRMLREYQAELPGYLGVLKSLLYDLLVNIYRAYMYKIEAFNIGERYKYGIIWDAVDYLKANFAAKLNLDEVCQHFYLSKSYFTKVFKRATGVSAFEYLQKIRMDEAGRLLTGSAMKISDIASEVGYSDYNYFNKTFKRIMGMTAHQYRIRHTKN